MTDSPEGADLVVLNTCHIREKATEKVYSELGKLKELREERLADGGARMTIAVAGCVAQAEGEEIMRRQPAVDLVVGPQAYHQLPELIARTHRYAHPIPPRPDRELRRVVERRLHELVELRQRLEVHLHLLGRADRQQLRERADRCCGPSGEWRASSCWPFRSLASPG